MTHFMYVQSRKRCILRLAFPCSMILQQRMVKSESTQFQIKCKKIGAIITRSGTNNRSPVVAILGWNFSHDKLLAKYSKMFENQGFDTVRIPSNPVDTVLRLNKAKEISLELLGILEEMKSSQNQPIFLFALSMGGFVVHHFIREAVMTPGNYYYKSIHVVGCIFDSCPSVLNFHSLKQQLIVLKTMQNPLFRALRQVQLIFIYPAFLLRLAARRQILQDSMALPMGCPELFLLSIADYVVSHKDIETFIDAHENKGIKVFLRRWEDSAHVRHYGRYPDEYQQEIKAFTDHCIAEHILKSRP